MFLLYPAFLSCDLEMNCYGTHIRMKDAEMNVIVCNVDWYLMVLMIMVIMILTSLYCNLLHSVIRRNNQLIRHFQCVNPSSHAPEGSLAHIISDYGLKTVIIFVQV